MSVRSSDLPGPRSQSTYPSDAVDMIPLSTVELQRRSQDTPNLSFSDAALDDITGPLPFEAQDADNAEMADQNRSLTGNSTRVLSNKINMFFLSLHDFLRHKPAHLEHQHCSGHRVWVRSR